MRPRDAFSVGGRKDRAQARGGPFPNGSTNATRAAGRERSAIPWLSALTSTTSNETVVGRAGVLAVAHEPMQLQPCFCESGDSGLP